MYVINSVIIHGGDKSHVKRTENTRNVVVMMFEGMRDTLNIYDLVRVSFRTLASIVAKIFFAINLNYLVQRYGFDNKNLKIPHSSQYLLAGK